MGNVLYGVWTFSPNDTWVAGASGTIIHWDGVMWTDHGTNDPAHIFAKVWGSGPDDVWVVGERRFILHKRP